MTRQHKKWQAEIGAIREDVNGVLKRLDKLQEAIRQREKPKDDSGM